MNNILEELNKLTSKDLNNLLENNKYIKSGSLVIYNNKIYKVLSRTKQDIVLRYGNGKGVFTDTIDQVKLLTKKDFDALNKEKYLTASFLNSLDKIKRYLDLMLSRVFKHNYDITINQSSREINVVIFYPEITVTNSLDLTHKMLDVYLTLCFSYSHNTFNLKRFSLFRGKFTPAEARLNYFFSHINHSYVNIGQLAWDSAWCLGSTAFKNYIFKCYDIMYPTDVLFLISQFHSYLSWESLEGVPYKRISDIKPFKTKIINIDTLDYDFNGIVKKVKKRLPNFTYIFTFENDSYVTKLTLETIERIKQIIKLTNPEYCFLNINGESVEIEEDFLETTEIRNSQIIEFKGENIIPVIVVTENSKETVNKVKEQFSLEPHQKIIIDVVEHIEKEFTNYLLKEKLKQI